MHTLPALEVSMLWKPEFFSPPPQVTDHKDCPLWMSHINRNFSIERHECVISRGGASSNKSLFYFAAPLRCMPVIEF